MGKVYLIIVIELLLFLIVPNFNRNHLAKFEIKSSKNSKMPNSMVTAKIRTSGFTLIKEMHYLKKCLFY